MIKSFMGGLLSALLCATPTFAQTRSIIPAISRGFVETAVNAHRASEGMAPIVISGDQRAIMSLVGVTDSAGNLKVIGATDTGVAGDTRAIGSLVGHTDSAGNLFVTLVGGAFTGQMLAPDGTLTAPSYSFSSDPDTGFFWGGSGAVIYTSNGNRYVGLASNTLTVAADSLIQWTNTAGNATATADMVLIRNGAAGRIAAYGGSASVGVELAIGSAQPTLTACGTGTLTAKSTNIAGEVTATGATACTINFGAPTFSNQPFCVVEEETTLATHRISAISTTAFTVTGLTAGDKFMYHCLGGK